MITLYFVSSFVARITYSKNSQIGLDLAEKKQFEKITEDGPDQITPNYNKVDLAKNLAHSSR